MESVRPLTLPEDIHKYLDELKLSDNLETVLTQLDPIILWCMRYARGKCKLQELEDIYQVGRVGIVEAWSQLDQTRPNNERISWLSSKIYGAITWYMKQQKKLRQHTVSITPEIIEVERNLATSDEFLFNLIFKELEKKDYGVLLDNCGLTLVQALSLIKLYIFGIADTNTRQNAYLARKKLRKAYNDKKNREDSTH